jgi:hypothetical protein
MTKSNLLAGLALLFALSSCGKSEMEETCSSGDCTETSINAPVGPQPVEFDEPDYDQVESNPKRETLRFPAFNASLGLKRSIYDKAVAFYARNRASLENPRYATLVDFSKHSSKRRLFLFDLSTGRVQTHNVSHGKNSDPDNNGIATRFSNAPGSQMSSLGAYKTLRTYNGGNGYSLKLDGLEATNDNALSRAIVIHPANYVSDSGRAGRSWGCPALDPSISKSVIDKIRNGSLLVIGN